MKAKYKIKRLNPLEYAGRVTIGTTCTLINIAYTSVLSIVSMWPGSGSFAVVAKVVLSVLTLYAEYTSGALSFTLLVGYSHAGSAFSPVPYMA